MQGKLDTEKLLGDSGVAWTSIRPVYIYGASSQLELLARPASRTSCI